MTLIRPFLLLLVAASALAAAPQAAVAVDAPFASGGQCVASGPFPVSPVAAVFNDALPSVRRLLSATGMLALDVGCLPSLVCYSRTDDQVAKKAASARCGVAARALVQTVHPQLRATAQRAIKVTVTVSPDYDTDAVYLSMAPGMVDYSQVKPTTGPITPLGRTSRKK